MRRVLAFLSALLVLGCAWLAAVELALHHPGFAPRALQDAMLAAISLAVGFVLRPSTARLLSGIVLGAALAAGVEGAFAVIADLRGPHFEGYVLLFGTGLALQALLALGLLYPRLRAAE